MNTKDLQLSGKARDFGWISEKQKAGKLYLGSDIVRDSIFEKLRTLIRLTNEIYENNWDIDAEMLDSEIVRIRGIVVYFPEVIIRNRDNKRHTIKDLFVKLALTNYNDELYIEGIYGGRTTWTYAEWTSGYSHSHLSGINNNGRLPFWSRFCTGSGHINDYMAQINGGEFSESLVTSLLVQIMSLVSYESIEGTPYRYIREIYPRTQSGSRFSHGSDTYKQLYNKLLTHYRDTGSIPILEFGIETGKYFVKDNEKFDEFLNSVQLSEREKTYLLCFIDSSGTAWRYGSAPNQVDVNLRNVVPYIFRGEQITPQVTNRAQEEQNITYKIHPQIRSQIKKEIEYEINRKTIRKGTIDKYQNKISNARESAESDKVLVQANS